MADFSIAYPLTIANEGGYGIDNNGAEVYRGINRLFNPTWQGWNVIDAIKKNYAYKNNWTDARADAYVQPYVKQNYWQPIQADKILNQPFANLLFDFFYESGANAVKELQKELGFTGADVDGILGRNTLAALNTQLQTNGENLYNNFYNDRYNFTQALVPKIISQNDWASIEKRIENYANAFVDEILKTADAAGNTVKSTVKKNPFTIILRITFGVIILNEIFKTKQHG